MKMYIENSGYHIGRPREYRLHNKYHSFEIPNESTNDFQVSKYGSENPGQHAVHLKYKNGKDIWFIYDAYPHKKEGHFVCVYHS